MKKMVLDCLVVVHNERMKSHGHRLQQKAFFAVIVTKHREQRTKEVLIKRNSLFHCKL